MMLIQTPAALTYYIQQQIAIDNSKHLILPSMQRFVLFIFRLLRGEH